MILTLLSVILIGAAIYCRAVFVANRRTSPYVGPIHSPTPPTNLHAASETLTVLTWNIGYGALGKDADSIVDKGRSMRALSSKDITLAAQRIAQRLAGQSADLICLQENANAGFLTRGVGLRDTIEAALSNRQNLFWADMKSVLVPQYLKIEHGMSVHARVNIKSCEAVLFPKDSTYFFGGLTKHYGSLINRISIGETGRDWVVFNIHLSAFDPDIRTRMGQLEKLLQLAQHEYDQGHCVVIAGDWNMRLTATDPGQHTGVPEKLQVINFPENSLNEGWSFALDTKTPTVRSLNAPYVAGKNATAIIDGFVCSPNVVVKSVSTADLGFADTDHHPVTGCFQAST